MKNIILLVVTSFQKKVLETLNKQITLRRVKKKERKRGMKYKKFKRK